MERKIIKKYKLIHRRMLKRDLIGLYVAIEELTDSDKPIQCTGNAQERAKHNSNTKWQNGLSKKLDSTLCMNM